MYLIILYIWIQTQTTISVFNAFFLFSRALELQWSALKRLFGPNVDDAAPRVGGERGGSACALPCTRAPPTPSSSCLPSAPSPVYSLTQCLKQHRRSPEESYSILRREKKYISHGQNSNR